MKRIRQNLLIVSLLFLAVWSGATLNAQTITSENTSGDNPVLQVDHGLFMADEEGKARLEVYYKVFNYGFVFEEKDGVWDASYEVLITVDTDNDVQIDRYERDRSITVESERKAKSTIDFRSSMASFVLPEGKYLITCHVVDRNAEDRSTSVQFEVEVSDFDEKGPVLSSILFAQAVQKAPEEENVFKRGNLLVVPSVSRTYGSETGDRLLYYVEIYRGSKDIENVVVETRIRQYGGQMVYRDTLTSVLDDPIERQLREISLTEFRPARYEMEISLLGRRNKFYNKIRQDFTVTWSDEALIKHDFKTALSQLELIAEGGELDSLKAAETTEARQKAYDAFWRRNDPTPGTPQNEAKEEFYRRVSYANRQFSILRREGWRTDRGRIYIEYGHPDQIDDVPMAPDYPPYQIWHYYTEGRYRRFTFIDENFDGEYRLAYPYDGLHQRPDF